MNDEVVYPLKLPRPLYDEIDLIARYHGLSSRAAAMRFLIVKESRRVKVATKTEALQEVRHDNAIR